MRKIGEFVPQNQTYFRTDLFVSLSFERKVEKYKQCIILEYHL